MTASRTQQIKQDAQPPVPEDANVAAGLPTAAETRAVAAAPGEATFTLDRLLSVEGGQILANALEGSGVTVPAGASEAGLIAGALHGVDTSGGVTVRELRTRVAQFLGHEDTTIPQEDQGA